MIALLLLPILVLSLGAGDATSRPSSDIRQWFMQLNDRDGDVREQAAENLMGLNRVELNELRDVVAGAGAISPAQSSALRDIVTQVFIESADYQLEKEDAPFLGLSWPEGMDPGDRVIPGQGVLVAQRVPGFSAYRMLRDGDIITGISELPGVKFESVELFVAAVRTFRPGQTVTLQVLRAGRTIRVPVELKQRPFGLRLQASSLEDWIQDMQARADAYWDKTFAPVLSGDTTAERGASLPPAPVARTR